MRSIDCRGLLLILACSVSAQSPEPPKPAAPQNLQTGYCPQTRQLEAQPSQKFFLDGAIGKRHVRMFLDRGGSAVVGLFFYLSGDWTPTSLGGDWNNGNIEMSDATETHPATGTLKASLAGDRLNGTWTAVNSTQPEPVRLVAIPEPHCDGKEKWRRFNDPEWPVSFSYPASWHLEQSDNAVVLTCPNPSEIAYGQHIVIHQGTGMPEGPTHIVQCGKSWIYGDRCDCTQKDQHACATAKVSRTNSATMLDVSEQEHRIYCLEGGYVAAGEGEDRVMLLRDQWLEINAPVNTSEMINRLANSVTPHERK
jgi:hypothetical protein